MATKIEITKEMIAKSEQLAARGSTEAEIAMMIGISEDTKTRRKKDNAEFAEAIKRGKARGESRMGLETE